MAATQPETRAVVVPAGRDAAGKARWKSWTYRELNAETDRLARGFESIGIRRGMRVIVLIRPGFECFATIFALFSIAAVPVIIDPGMGVSQMAGCLGAIGAEAFVGSSLAHILRLAYRRHFRAIRINVTAGRRWFWGGHELHRLAARSASFNEPEAPAPGPLPRSEPEAEAPGPAAHTVPMPSALRPTRLPTTSVVGSDSAPSVADVSEDETAAILFTTGSTGPAKPVVYTHGIFAAQFGMLRDCFDIRPGEVDLATFLLFGLFAPGLGMTSVLPEMNFTQPGQADPRKIIEAITDNGVTNMFGSPALLDRVGRFAAEHPTKLGSVRRVITAGAPVRRDILERFSTLLVGEAQIFTPYGATEALPVACMGSREILSESRPGTPQSAIRNPQSAIHNPQWNWGVCVGRPLPEIDVRVIRITDDPIERWSDDLLAPPGEIGEIVVRGPIVTREYFGNTRATALAKIDLDPSIPPGLPPWSPSARDSLIPDSLRPSVPASLRPFFHRMGDVGCFDDRGRLWMCGRKSHRVETEQGPFFTIPCEAVFNQHLRVRRTALVGVPCDPNPKSKFQNPKSPYQTPVLCVELHAGNRRRSLDGLTRELLALGAAQEHTRTIRTILYHPRFPVDIRHNAKIFRERLALWAARRVGR